MTWINDNIEKQLAIMKQEGEDFLLIEDGENSKIWSTGKTLSELEDEYQYSDEDDTFNQWVAKNYEEVEVEEYDENSSDWLVCTDQEADDKWEEELDSYIDECVLPMIPEGYRNYFDDERYKQDCKYDGRGHLLAIYDGAEYEQEINGTTYYLYRQN